MLETREINKSLSVLKECITRRAQWTLAKGEGGQKHVHIPFRGSKLTQVLKSAFDVGRTGTVKTIVVACIAPGILDVGHSKNTLRYAESMLGSYLLVLGIFRLIWSSVEGGYPKAGTHALRRKNPNDVE